MSDYALVQLLNNLGVDMTFGEAITLLRHGHKVARSGWNGQGTWVEMQVPDGNSKMTMPYLYMYTADTKLVPWFASQADMLSDDWQEVPL